MSKKETKKLTFKERYEAVSKLVDGMQKEAAERRFDVKFEDPKQIKTLMEHLNKGYTWKTQNAAVIVSLYDQLKNQSKTITATEISEEESSYVIKLRGHELNALYQALLNVEGQGVETARRFITMLTHIGEAVGIAMQELTQVNADINEAHSELSTLERMIAVYGENATEETTEKTEQVEPELEQQA